LAALQEAIVILEKLQQEKRMNCPQPYRLNN